MITLYLAGWGRSGSTILGNVLGELPGFLSVGELRYVSHPDITCGCGCLVADCPFWQEVVGRAEGEIGPVDWSRFRVRQQRALAPKRVPALLRGRLGAEAAEVTAVTQALRRAASEVAGAGVVVDGSKHPGDLAALHAADELRVVHLVRDPRATTYSWSRRVREGQQALGAASATGRWIEWNLLVELVLRRVPPARTLRVRYEDFVLDPAGHVARIAKLAGLEAPVPGGAVETAGVKLGQNHAIGGNPSKFHTGDVRLVADTDWRNELGAIPQAAVMAAAWPLMLRYGYLRRGGNGYGS